MELERCVLCDEPTGNAGKGEDSFYLDNGDGPYCEDCFDILTGDFTGHEEKP